MLEAMGQCPVGATDLTRRRGASVRASSEETATTPARFAIDGHLDTRWASEFEDKQFLELELGGRYEVRASGRRPSRHTACTHMR